VNLFIFAGHHNLTVKRISKLAVPNMQVCAEMGVEAPLSVSAKQGDVGNVLRRIVDVGHSRHLSIPETEQGSAHKHFKRLIRQTLTFAAGKLLADVLL